MVYNNKKIQNVGFDLLFFYKYKYKYIWVDKKMWIQIQTYFVCIKGRIQIQRYTGGQKTANINTNMNVWPGICEYKYKYKFLSHTVTRD